MTSPRLTVVVPTHDRPTLLPRAIDSALRQTAAVRVVVADNGDVERTHGVLRDRYPVALRDGTIVHIGTGEPEPWGNWRAGAEAVETPFMAFLQDDDLVSDFYAERILFAFDEAEKLGAHPLVWFGRLDCSDASGTMSIPMAGNGPMVPMRSLHGVCEPAHYRGGHAVPPSMLLTSWSLSPALAYRTGGRYRETLARIETGLDMYVERLMPAYMAIEGGFIADPAIVGLWVQHSVHGAHLSHQQWPDQPRQTRGLIAHLDAVIDTLPDWERQFAAWCGVIPPAALLQWSNQLDTTEQEGGRSRHGRRIREIMWESMSARIKVTAVASPWWKRPIDWARSRIARAAARPEPPAPPTLAEIVRRGNLATDKTTVHSYHMIYSRILNLYRDREIRLLEIGVAAGGSLRLWREYFGRATEIVGVDLKIQEHARDLDEIATLVEGDAYADGMADVLGTFDIVVDDGPHTLESQIAAIRLYAPRLRPGGLLAIEDVQDPSWFAELIAAVPDGYAGESIDLRHVKGRYDDLVVLVRAPATLPTAELIPS